MAGEIVLVVAAFVAGGLLTWWAFVKFGAKPKKGGRWRY
jgi:hypothetical protein